MRADAGRPGGANPPHQGHREDTTAPGTCVKTDSGGRVPPPQPGAGGFCHDPQRPRDGKCADLRAVAGVRTEISRTGGFSVESGAVFSLRSAMSISRRHMLRLAAGVTPLVVLGIPRDAQASMMGRLFDWLNSRPVETPRPGEGILEFAARVVPEVTANDKFYVQSIGHTSPRLSRRKWRLNVEGESNRFSFNYLGGVEHARAGEKPGRR